MTDPSNEIPGTQVSHVAVKIPPLWKSNIKLWFIQLESNFELAKITNDATKYNHLITAIDPETLTAVSDILFSPPETNKYETLKERLIAEFSASENEQIRRLISELHLGNDKPSHMLRKMRELGGSNVKDDFLKTLWFQRLPPEIQTILSISSESLDNLAKMADKIADVRAVSENVFAVARSAESAPSVFPPDEINILRSEIAALNKKVERLTFRNSHRGNNPRQRSSSRGRSQTRDKNYCYYHSRFGSKAHKCRSPCSYNANTESENCQ